MPAWRPAAAATPHPFQQANVPAGCLSRRSHTWLATGNAVRAIERAVLHAGWKVGGSYPAGVTLTSAQLDTLEALCAVEATVGRWDTEQPS
jgi:hypothetical protein